MCLLSGKAGFWVAVVIAGLTLNAYAFGQNNGAQQTQARSPVPLTDRTPGATESAGRPAYLQLRYNEDWSFLRDPSKRTGSLDRIKYLPLGRENWYLTVGGEVRLYYENYRNELWGSEPADDNGFWLQRFMLHADWHLGQRVRIHGQTLWGAYAVRPLRVIAKDAPKSPTRPRTNSCFANLRPRSNRRRVSASLYAYFEDGLDAPRCATHEPES